MFYSVQRKAQNFRGHSTTSSVLVAYEVFSSYLYMAQLWVLQISPGKSSPHSKILKPYNSCLWNPEFATYSGWRKGLKERGDYPNLKSGN